MSDDGKIIDLAGLTPLEYEKRRRKEAETLGIRAGALDKIVKTVRKKTSDEGLKLPEPDPWPEAVDGDDLLDQLVELFHRYLALPKGGAELLALWVAHAHAFDLFQITPRLALLSPERRCGKTTTLSLLSRLVPRPLPAANITAAAVFRTVEAAKPTLLLDEADTFIPRQRRSSRYPEQWPRQGHGLCYSHDRRQPRAAQVPAGLNRSCRCSRPNR